MPENMVSIKSYEAPGKDVLLAPHLAFAVSVTVSNTGVSSTDGKKIIKAGTPIGGSTSVLTKRSTVLQVTNDSGTGAQAQGILRNDLDVTNGNAVGSMIVFGFIDESKCPTIAAEAKTALTKITFVNGGVEE